VVLGRSAPSTIEVVFGLGIAAADGRAPIGVLERDFPGMMVEHPSISRGFIASAWRSAKEGS
jgi:hypothetical protein